MHDHHQPAVLSWVFPIDRPHAGALIGNGVQGLMLWGTERRLIITVGRQGFWDHRGGNDFTTRTTYAEVRCLLEAGDEAGLRRVFGIDDGPDGGGRPHQLGCGRLVIELPEGWSLVRCELDLRTAVAALTLDDGHGATHTATVRQAVDRELSQITLPAAVAAACQIHLEPTWNQIEARLHADGCPPPRWRADRTAVCQDLPADDGVALGYHRSGETVALATALGSDPLDAVITIAEACDDPAIWQRSADWWSEYWAAVPRVSLPDPLLAEIFAYGLYKQACATPPQGLACCLQGPFLEDYQLPPWSADYHFNINLQMTYWPALATNRPQHFEPLWRMIRRWWPTLTANAAAFFQAEDAFMLPHAVDDRCQVVGAFWTGSIDHACTAWMAQLAWQHYRATMDGELLRDLAWPMLRGAFAGYWAMLEEGADGRLSLPVSVSPEFRGSTMGAWGRDASFQLAALHMLVDLLPRAAAALDEAIDPRWDEVRRRLPPYTLVEGPRFGEYPHTCVRRIGLWQDQDLSDSHRHHSHLGAIYPFCTVDPTDEAHRQIVADSLFHWVYKGAGAWSGWCVPWAATIWARCGNGEGAVAALHFWHRHFVNEGRGTLHDAAFPGGSVIQSPARDNAGRLREVMQLEAGFGALNAICEMLVQLRGDELHVLPCRPQAWRMLSFDGIRSDGAFLIGATVRDGAVVEVRVESLAGSPLCLVHGLAGGCRVDGQAIPGTTLKRHTTPGQRLVLHPLATDGGT